MPSERIQRRIERLLDETEQALDQQNWELAVNLARQVLLLDASNADAAMLLASAEGMLAPGSNSPSSPAASPVPDPAPFDTATAAARAVEAKPIPPVGAQFIAPTSPLPAAFANGRYQVKKFLGEGGKKRVYLAHDTLLDRDVAFALIKSEGLDDAGRLRIQREAQAMGRLGAHPHIVSVFDLGEEEGQPFIVTELMGGGDVEGVVEKAPEHRPSLERALEIAVQVCRGLEFAHAHGIVHRDLKPGNVWLTADGTAKLGDFGLAVALDKSRLTQGGMMVGTVSYMPPEQAMGGEVTPRSDLYSLGAMLYEMVTGRPPFVGDESVAIITQHLNIPPVSPTWHRPDCPPALEALIMRLLEKDPSRRPASAQEVGEALGSIASSGAGAMNRAPTGDAANTGGAPLMAPEGPGTRGNAQAISGNPIYRRAFVGREQELRQLQSAFDGALSGQGALTMIVGEPGIGKTALCEQLATYVAVRGGKALVGHSYEEGSLSLPYLPFVEALRSYVLEREPEALARELGTGAADVARIVSEIRDKVPNLESAGARHAAPTSGDPEDERWRLYQAVTGFLRNASAVQPLVIVLEDLHWADRGTLDYLLHLSRNLQGARLLVVGTYRDVEVDRSHPLSATLAELRRASSFSRVLLRGLTVDEVQRMINAMQGQEVRWSFAEAIHRQTEGNPLFIQEVLRYLVEEGLIQRQGDHWEGRWRQTGESPPELAVPEGLRDVIGKRLSHLSPGCNQLLAIASVIGRDFALAVLTRVAGQSEEQVIANLEEARHAAVIEARTAVGGSISFRFSHAFFRQTLYEEIFAPRRIRMHQQVGQALEAVHARRLEEHAAELAEHFAQSPEPETLRKALHYGELSARRALGVYAYGEAAQHWQRCLEVQEVLDPEDKAKRCDLLVALGEALGPSGEPQRVYESVAEEALALAEALADRRRAVRVCMMALTATERYGGAAMGASPARRQWLERLDGYAAPDTPERVQADLVSFSVRFLAARWAEANSLRVRALEQARRLDDPEMLFRAAFSNIGSGYTPPRHQPEALRLAGEFSTRPREGVSATTLTLLLDACQAVYLQAGDRARAEELWRELEELSQRTRDPVLLLWPLNRDAIRATLDGELEEAIAAAGRLVERAEELGSPVRGRFFADQLTFWPLIYLGRAEEALATLANARRGEGAQGWSQMRFGRVGLCLAMMARTDEARTRLREALERFRVPLEGDEVFAIVLADLLASAVAAEDREAMTLLRERLAGIAAVGHIQTAPANVARFLGAAAALLGDREPARGDYERSLAWATKIRHRPEVALTRLQIAELLLAPSPNPSARAIGNRQSAVDPATLSTAYLPASKASELPTASGRSREVVEHLDFAIAEFRAMKMQPALERALRHKEVLKA